MDYASILRVLVQVDGLTKGTAELSAFDAAQKKVAGNTATTGRGLDTLTGKVQAFHGDAAKVTTIADNLGDGMQRAGQRAAGAGDGLDQASRAASTMGGDLARARSASDQAAAALTGLLGDTDDYTTGLLRSHGANTQATEAAHQLAQARQTLSGQVGGLLGEEDDLASVLQRSHQAHQDAVRSTTDLDTATRRLPQAITAVNSGFSQASLSVTKAREELDRTGNVSQSTSSALANLGSRGVAGLDRDLTRTHQTLRKAEAELAATGDISRRTARDLTNLGAAGGGAGGGIGAFLGALSAGGGGLSAFGLSLLVAMPAVVALIGAVGALAAALGPLAGLAAAAGVAVSAAGQGFGVFKLATMGVADALKEQTTAQATAGSAATSSAQQQRSAARAIQSAQDGVRSAHEQVRSATQALTNAQQQAKVAQTQLNQARTDARRGLVDMAAGLQQSQIAEMSAIYALKDAKTALSELVNGPSAAKVAEATQAVTTAIHNQQSAVLGLGDAQRAYDDLIAGPGPLQLLQATQSVTSALHGQLAAQMALTDAKKAYDDLINGPSVEDQGKAALSLSQAQHAQQQAAMDLAAAQAKADQVKNSSTATDAQKAKAALDLANAQDNITAANFRVKDAQDALDKINAGPTDDEKAKAVLAIGMAQDQVDSSTNAVTTTQQALDKLNAGPTDTEKAKALLAISQAQDQVADATNAQTTAQAALDKLNAPASGLELGKALLAVARAQADMAVATRDRRRQEKDLAAAQKAGVDGSAEVLAASRALRQAHQQETNANRQLRDAVLAVSRAEQAVGDAQANAADQAANAATAAGKLNKAMDALPAPAQAFVRQLVALKPKLDEVRTTAAAGLFPGVSAGLTAAMHNFEPVKKVVGQTATALGDLTRKAGEMIGSPAWGKDIETVGGRNAKIIGTVGDAALHVVNAIRHVIVAAGPLTSWLAKTADGWARQLDASAKAGRESGKLAGFFDKTRNVLQRIGSITAHVASGLLGVGKAGAKSGGDMLAAIDRAAKRFDAWTHSDQGQNKLTEFFERSKELLKNLIPVLNGVGKATATIGFGPMNTALKLAGPYAEQLTYAFLAYKVVATAAGAATTAYTVATKGAQAAQWLLNAAMTANPVGLIIIGIAALGAALVLAYTKVKWFHDAVDAVWGWIKDHWPLLAGILFGPFGVAASQIITHWGAITDFFQALPGKIRDLLKAGAGALTAAGKWLVDTIVGGIKSATSAVGDGASWLKDQLVGAIKAVAGAFGAAGVWVLDTIIGGFKTVTSALSSAGAWLRDQISGLVHGTLDALTALGVWVLDRVVGGFKTITSALSGLGGWLKNRAVELIHAEADALTTLGTWVLDKVVGGFKVLTGALSGVGGWLYRQVMDTVHGTADSLLSLGGWVLTKLVDGIQYVSDKGVSGVTSVGGWLLGQLTDLLHGLKKDFLGLGGDIIDWIVSGLKAGAIKVQDFLNDILHVINKLPGVDIKDINIIHRATGGPISQITGQAVASGGLVDKPVIMMGEEAPRHPEWVIPTNPAYRSRALGLHAAAGKALGLAQGGVFSSTAYGPPWTGINGGGVTATGVDLRANPHVLGVAVDPSVIKLGSSLNIDPNPFDTNKAFQAFDTGSAIQGRRIDFYDWRGRPAQYDWGTRNVHVSVADSGGGGGILGALGGAAGAVGDVISQGAGALLGLLPDTGSLPDWLKGTGKFLLDHATDWIKDKFNEVVGGAVHGDDQATGPAGGGGLSMFDGVQVANWIIPALEWARRHGWTGHITSGYRSPDQVVTNPQGIVAPQGHSNHNLTAYPGGAIDVGDPGARAAGQALYQALLNYPGPRRLVWGGPAIGDWGHFSATGHAIGGILGKTSGAWAGLPYGGSFADGGIVPGPLGAPTAIIAHGGERVTPATNVPATSGEPTVQQNFHGPVYFHDERDAIVLAREVGWEVSR